MAANRRKMFNTLPEAPKFDRQREDLGGILLTAALVAAVTLMIFAIIWTTGRTRGTVLYLIPVVIAATRWGIVSALFAAICGVLCSAFLFFPPFYSFRIRDPQEVINLLLFVFAAVVVSQLAARLKHQLEIARQREIDVRDLYAFSRRLAVAFDASDIHLAIEDHLTAVTQRKVVVFPDVQTTKPHNRQDAEHAVPDRVFAEVMEFAVGQRSGQVTVAADNGEIWLVRPTSPRDGELHVLAIDLGHASLDTLGDLRARVDSALTDATATLERLDIAHAINEAHMRSQTDRLREALIGSVSHELRTPLASILGAATVLSAAPGLQGQTQLQALVADVRSEAERLNDDIQNLLDATRISSDGIKPQIEWADPGDIVDSALDRCGNRLLGHMVVKNMPSDLPLVHVDPVLVRQALVQIFDNAAKYSPPGSRITIAARARDGRMILSVSDQGAGLTVDEESKIWGRFARGERHAITTSGSGLGLWIANAFVTANDGTMNAISDGPGLGATLAIELPVTRAAVPQLESDADE
jgi:two-component system sensor histidine kinase KdpD